MINLNKSNTQFSLKNVDTAKLTQVLTEHQNSLIRLVLMVGTLVIIGFMFNDYRIKDQALVAQMSQGQQKMDVIKVRDTTIQHLNDFESSLPKKLTESEIITLISNYAQLDNIVITSLSPAESRDMGLYDVINISFNATSDDFKEMVLFLRKIERSNFSLRINSWSGHEEVSGKINFVIEISAVLIHT